MSVVLRVVVLAVAAVVVVLVPAASGDAPALAHTGLDASTPADGAHVDAAPEEVTLTFTEDVLADYLQLAVTGPDGAAVTAGAATVDGPVVSQPVTVTAPGAHVVAYRVVSADGHPVSGRVTFSVTGAPSVAGTAAPASTPVAAPTTPDVPGAAGGAPAAEASASSGGTRWWPVPAVLVGVAGLALLAASRRRRRSTR